MIPASSYLDPRNSQAFWTATAFLRKRLAEQATIDWALKLKPNQRIERIAIAELITGPHAPIIEEPWASAWRLIEESWSKPPVEGRNGTSIYGIQQRLRAGDRSGAAAAAIVGLVAPRLEVKSIEAWPWNAAKKPRKPKKVEHVLSASLTSGYLVDLNELELANLNHIAFLTSLAKALEAAVNYGLDIALRLGWDGQGRHWRIGGLERAYYVAYAPTAVEDGDPDAFHQGIAPSVKLLHAVVARLAELDAAAAKKFVRRWKLDGSPVHLRLWAAMSRQEQITAADEVAAFLTTLDQERFWDLHKFPEFAELRSVRLSDMNAEAQNTVIARIKKGPPRHFWHRKMDTAKVKDAKFFWRLRELRRIEVGGATLPDRAKAWLEDRLPQFPELSAMTIDEGFAVGVTVNLREANPDPTLDTISGVERLKELEAALGTGRRSWEDDPAQRADAWIKQQSNVENVLADFETTDNGGTDFPKVWDRFGWAHRPRQPDGDAAQDAMPDEVAGTVLSLLNQLSGSTLSKAIEGVCAWLDAWRKHAVKLPQTLPIWLRLWPIAVEVTNRTPEGVDDESLSITQGVVDDDREPMDLDTLNTPAGKLVGVFLAACPTLTPEPLGFPVASMQRQMRDVVIAAKGRSGLIAKHRTIEELPYFLGADPVWAREHLITPLRRDDGAAFVLWRAVARRTHFTKVLQSIGPDMAKRANDRRLGRKTRSQLVFSLVVESLHAFREGRTPAVPNQRVQQMLRTLDDELRASAASVIQKFVRDLSAGAATSAPDSGEEQEDPASAAGLFRAAAAPFLREVWPQERSLTTPGVSRALADLPATSGEAFAEAVDTIARFLVPFECWSMLDYRLFGNVGEKTKLDIIINSELKAKALLRLLDLTVGHAEGSVVPYDLAAALEQIRVVSPASANDPAFRRLETASRR